MVDEKTPAGTVEWRSILTKIRQTKPSIIYFNDHVTQNEIAFLKQFHTNPTKSLIFMQYGPSNPAFINLGKKKTNDIFWGTHEPCPLCLSAITWAGYDNFYYFFSHEDSRDSFNIVHDLKILKEVFMQDPGGYARENAYWKACGIRARINNCDESTRKGLLDRVEKLKKDYAQIAEVYQKNKEEKVWQRLWACHLQRGVQKAHTE